MSHTLPSSTGTVAVTGRPPHTTLIVVYLSLGGVAFAVLQSLVAPALTTIANDLGATASGSSWILTAYLLSAAVMTPVLGRLGDMVGKRRMLIVVLSMLLAGTVISALAPNLLVLVLGRVLQGAAGAIAPLSIAVIRDEVQPDRVGVTIGLISALFGVGAGIGIVAAGPIVENLSWHWLFWLPAVLVAIALLGVIFGMPESPVKTPGRLDLLGTAILTVGLVASLLGVSEGGTWGWASWETISLLALGAVALMVFVVVELRVKEPLMDLRLMKIRGVWTAHVVALIFGFAMFGNFLLVPNLLLLPTDTGYGFGQTVSAAGLYMLPTVLMMVVFGPVAGILVKKMGPKVPMVLGGVLVTAAFALPAIVHGELWHVVLSGVLTGAGIGLALAAVSNAIVESVPAAQTGEAISVNTITRTVGSSIGTAAIAAVVAASTTEQGLPLDDAFTNGFLLCAIVAIVAIVAAVASPSFRGRREGVAGEPDAHRLLTNAR